MCAYIIERLKFMCIQGIFALLFHLNLGNRAGACGGPHQAGIIRGSSYLKSATEIYGLVTLPCGPPVGGGSGPLALRSSERGERNVFSIKTIYLITNQPKNV